MKHEIRTKGTATLSLLIRQSGLGRSTVSFVFSSTENTDLLVKLASGYEEF